LTFRFENLDFVKPKCRQTGLVLFWF